MHNRTAIGIDLGGTSIKAVALDAGGQLLHRLTVPTHDGDGQPWKTSVQQLVRQLEGYMLPRFVIGISAPGLPDAANKAIAFMPGRMQGLEGWVWQDFLQQPAFVINDAVAALLSEVRLGAARDARHAVMVTLGTGVGGAILIDGKPYQGAFAKAGHIGHMVIDEQGECDITGIPGSLEDCIGNCTVEKRSGGRFTSTHALLEAYRTGDDFAASVWLRSVKQLAIGLASLTNILSPDTIVIGGGIAEAGTDLFDPLEQYLQQYEWRPGGQRAIIVKATGGELAGAKGAALFAMENTII